MVVATRVMYLMSGVLVLASGVCIEARLLAQWSEPTRLIVLLAALAYFGWQLGRFLMQEYRLVRPTKPAPGSRKLGLDFVRQ